jgi:hypothetical protein
LHSLIKASRSGVDLIVSSFRLITRAN